ncbi:MAG: hypothetical protein ATN36_08725 [Epulopiscium sp. Nele67-Bin005]|nr:MAG: hypothetical protein ATN36_08725 [Epulopiscium sp. Nele67-Bin005]
MIILDNATPILGNTLDTKGATFGIYATDVDEIILSIFKEPNGKPVFTHNLTREDNAIGNIFCIKIEGVEEGFYYTFTVERNEKEVSILDPYAYEATKEDGIFYNKIVTSSPNPTKKPNIPWDEMIIYEMHIGHFTKHPSSNVQHPATLQGIIEKLDYLKELGITTIELLPVYYWNRNTIINRHPKTGELLTDVWGYNPISFFIFDPVYAMNETNSRQEFKDFVNTVHEHGMEVILDVVYNHTGEGGDKDTCFNFKALADRTYYRYYDETWYANCSGTGNTLNTSHHVVQEMTIASLRYWAIDMGVDGFRFDLASILGQGEDGNWTYHSLLKRIKEDGVLSHVKLITESWDAKGQYDVGKMPAPYHEWSDVFRDCMRRFMKGDKGVIHSVTKCIMGRELVFDHEEMKSLPIHYMTAHDGFTLYDLVSYNEKHNEENGEQNRDGHSHNISWNSGFEGENNDLYIKEFRERRMKTFLSMLFLSKGVPMLLMGDEVARTQKGNNNAFCQDSELVWFDWERAEEYSEMYRFTQKLISLRKHIPWLTTPSNVAPNWHGVKLYSPDWNYHSRSLAWSLNEGECQIYFVVNNYWETLRFELPHSINKWKVYINTAHSENVVERDITNDHYTVPPFTFCVLIDMPRDKNGKPLPIDGNIIKTI